MDQLALHIEYLVENHSCATLPGLGSLVSRDYPAAVDLVAGTITPPGREVTFNSSLTHDDGVLVSSVARRDRLSYTEALSRVRAAIELVRSTLDGNMEYDLGAIGTLVPLGEGRIGFTPRRDSSRCLPTVHFAPAAQQSAETTPTHRPAILTLAKYAAAIAVMLIVTLVSTTPVIEDSDIMLASLAPTTASHNEATDSYAPLDNYLPLYITAPCDNNVQETATVDYNALLATTPVEATPRNAVTNDTAANEEPAYPTLENNGSSYYLIVASLPTQELARQFIADSRDNSLQIVASDGRYRVYAAEAATAGALDAAKWRTTYPYAWVLHIE